MYRSLGLAFFAAFLMIIAGCDTAPKTEAGRQALQDEAQAALNVLSAKDSSLADTIRKSSGYVIFPEVGKGGLIIGGAYGRGVLYQGGQAVGYAELNQASIGAQLGGQTYIELLVFENNAALERFKVSNYDLGANASAVAITAGAGAAARFENGVAVFTMPKGGAMFEASVSGQKFNFQPLDQPLDKSAANPANTK